MTDNITKTEVLHKVEYNDFIYVLHIIYMPYTAFETFIIHEKIILEAGMNYDLFGVIQKIHIEI